MNELTLKSETIYLNKINSERRKVILERFFKGFFDNQSKRSKKGCLNVCKELKITGTNSPKYTIESIEQRQLKLTLEI